MHSYNKNRVHFFQADANALGGVLDEPFHHVLNTAAPTSLPAAGGFASARAEASNFQNIVSYSSAHTLVSGRLGEDGSVTTQATAVIENLNLLEVVTAERIVAQLSLTLPPQGPWQLSLAGTRFEGLRLAGRPGAPVLNAGLATAPRTTDEIRQSGREQAGRLIDGYKAKNNEDAYQWVLHRHAWMTAAPESSGDPVLCSLVDGFDGSESERKAGHIVEIPGFGRVFLGELLVSGDTVQLVSIRAELGCPVKGVVTGPTPLTSGGGSGPDRRAEPGSPNTGAATGKSPMTSGGGSGPDR